MASKLDRLQKKGFKVNEAALSKIARGDQEPGGEYSEININDIEENPDNALYRELDTEEDIALLADDIRRAGLLHNLVVFPKTGVLCVISVLQNLLRTQVLPLWRNQKSLLKEVTVS